MKAEEISRLEWASVKEWVKQRFGKYPSVTSLLFIVGLQETGMPFTELDKETKQDIIHVGNCAVLSLGGYYKHTGVDKDGWPHFEATAAFNTLTSENQENVIKQYIIEYFKKEIEDE